MAETESFRRSRTSFFLSQVRKGLMVMNDVPKRYRAYGICKWCGGPTLVTLSVCKNCEKKSERRMYLLEKNQERRRVDTSGKTQWERIKEAREHADTLRRQERIRRFPMLISEIQDGQTARPIDNRVPVSKGILAALHPKPSRRNFRNYNRPGYCKRCDISLTGRFAGDAKYGFCGSCRVQSPQSKTG